MIRIHSLILVRLHTQTVETHSDPSVIASFFCKIQNKTGREVTFTYAHNRHVKTHGMQDTEGGIKSAANYTLLHEGLRTEYRGATPLYTTKYNEERGTARVQNLHNIRHDQTQTITVTFKIWLIELSHFLLLFSTHI